MSYVSFFCLKSLKRSTRS